GSRAPRGPRGRRRIRPGAAPAAPPCPAGRDYAAGPGARRGRPPPHPGAAPPGGRLPARCAPAAAHLAPRSSGHLLRHRPHRGRAADRHGASPTPRSLTGCRRVPLPEQGLPPAGVEPLHVRYQRADVPGRDVTFEGTSSTGTGKHSVATRLRGQSELPAVSPWFAERGTKESSFG